jgi:hypothetical protein
VVLGLVVLLAAVVVGVAGVFNNLGSGHALTPGFSVFGYHVTGSTGVLFLYGIVIGAAALLGLSLLLRLHGGPYAAATLHGVGSTTPVDTQRPFTRTVT